MSHNIHEPNHVGECIFCGKHVGKSYTMAGSAQANPTDTNQASGDDLREQLADKLEWYSRYRERGQNDDMDRAFDGILALIRTEKLKLLAEVRERVVGEHKPKTRGLTQNPNNAAYWTKVSQAEFDLIEQQLNNLDKLEAEL